jgi:hypothetical protein
MDGDGTQELLDGLVFSTRLVQASIHARFNRANVVRFERVSEDDARRPQGNELDEQSEMDTSNWMVAAITPKSSGAHVVLRHEVTKRLAEHPEQFTSLTASELGAIGDYFNFTEQPDAWDPFSTEKEQPGILRVVLGALSKVDHAWYLSLFEGNLGFGRTGARP